MAQGQTNQILCLWCVMQTLLTMFSYFAQSLLLIYRTYRGLLHSKGLGSKYNLIFRGQGQIHKICLNGLKRKLLPNILMEVVYLAH